jgi:hypothetical protein
MGLLVGAFLMVAVKKAVILLAVGAVLVPLIVGLIWNYAWGRRPMLRCVRRYPDTELRGAIDGQYVKVTGVISMSLFTTTIVYLLLYVFLNLCV